MVIKLRIAVISSFGTYPERLDGPAVCIYHLIREWSESGHECHLFAGTRKADLIKEEFGRRNVVVHPIRKNWGWMQSADVLSRYVSSPLTIISLMRVMPQVTLKVFLELRQLGPEVVIYNALTVDPLAPLPFLIKSLGIPQVARMPVYFPSELNTLTANRITRTLGSLFYKTIMRQMDRIIVHSKRTMNEVMQHVPVEISIVSHGVHLASNTGFSSKDTFNILFVGRVSEEKGIECLLKALAVLSKNLKQRLETKIVGVGSDTYVEYVKREIKRLNLNTVKILGGVDHKKLERYYDDADVFVLASRREGMPLVILEAMAHAKPVIATKVGGIPELVKHGINGLLFDPDNFQQLAQHLTNLVENRKVAIELGLKAQETAKQMSWGTIAKRYTTLFELARVKANKAL